MPTFVWNLDTNIPTLALTDQTTAQYSSARGGSDLRLILARGSFSDATEVQLDGATPSGYVVGFILRDPNNLDQAGELQSPTTLTRGATADDGYIGSTSTDTAPVRTLMGMGTPGGNQSAYTVNAVFYYVPVGGGNPVESQPFPWTITPAYYQPGAPPVTQYVLYPSQAQLIAAVAAAAAAQPKLPTPASNGLFLTGNTDGSVSWSALPTTLTLASLTVSGTATVGALNCGDLVTSAGFSGSGSGLTNLNASNLTSGTVPPARLPAAVIGSSHYKGTWNASTNTPTLASGTGEPGGFYVVNAAGTTSLDGTAVWRVGDQVIFDGARWDKIDGSGNALVTVDGVTGDANGNAALPSDGDPGTATKRTLGPGANQAARGNDARFPASVTGIRKGAGVGSNDDAAVPGTDLAPFHPVIAGSPPTVTLGSGVSTWYGTLGSPYFACSDVRGVIGVNLSGAYLAGTLLATVTFATAYSGRLPLVDLFPRYMRGGGLQFTVTNSGSHAGMSFDLLVISYVFAADGSSISFYLENALDSGTNNNLAWQFELAAG